MNSSEDPLMNRRDFVKLAGGLGSGLGLAARRAKGNILFAKHTKEASFSTDPDWEQNFEFMSDGKLDSQYWSIDTGNTIPSYNNEAQTLTNRSENVRIQDGLLIIEARKERLKGKNYTSGHVNTQDKFSFQYGKLEVDLRVPKGVGTWPAAWLLPNAANATWPLDGEIDFFESVGFLPGKVYPDVHTYDTNAIKENNTVPLDVPDMATKFNTYGVELTPGKVTFTHNGKAYRTIEQTSENHRSWPFNQPYFLILNLAMGGDWGGQKRGKDSPEGIEGDGPWEMAVQAVRFYNLAT